MTPSVWQMETYFLAVAAQVVSTAVEHVKHPYDDEAQDAFHEAVRAYQREVLKLDAA